MADSKRTAKGHGPGSAIAIVGIGCRLPGARDHHELSRNVREGVSSIREITPDRWDPAVYFSPDIDEPNKSISKWCGLVDDPWCFDHGFFRVSPKEAKLMDPQQRVLLEETWHCIEDAGVPLHELQRWKTAVFVGVMARDHLQRASAPSASIESHSALGGYDCILANRVSHVLGLRGKSMAIDAACASSLVAIHEGVQALRSGDADAVLAGGVSLDLHPWKYISFSKARMLSPDGQCKTFDKDANGYVPGEGVAVVMLRRLEDAIADGQHVYGIVRGSAVNHVGAGSTITAPSVSSQADVIRTALQRSGVDPSTVTYVEAHGTGTSLGDPIEIEALTTAFREATDKRQFCLIGSLKTNIGHLEATAGVAGVIKVLMMMRERHVPPSLNVRTLNPLIDFESSPFRVSLALSPWLPSARGQPLRAGVSSFGMGGVNSHLIIEEAPAPARAATGSIRNGRRSQVPPRGRRAGGAEPFVLSARSRERLDALVERWRAFAADETFSEMALGDICGTLATARATHTVRFGGLVATHEELRALLARGAADVAPAAGFALAFGAEAGASAASPVLAALEARGARPSFVVGGGDGIIAALVATGMLDERAAKGLVAGSRGSARSAAPPLRRPTIPLLDPISGRLIAAFEIEARYFEDLDASAGVSPDEAARLAREAALLVTSQFTFRGHLEEWSRALVGAGARAIVRDGELVPDLVSARRVEPRQALAGAIAIQNALDRVNHKWNLSRARIMRDGASGELLDLLLDGVIGVEAAARLLTGAANAVEDAVTEARLRVDRVDAAKPWASLRARNDAPHELGDVSRWLAAARNAELPSRLDVPVLLAGGARARIADCMRVDRTDAHDGGLDEALMELWLRGVDVAWDRAFAGRPHRRVPLPTYPFARDQHMLAASGAAARPPIAPAPAQAVELVALRPRWVEDRSTTAATLHAAPLESILVFVDAHEDGARARAAFGAKRLHVVRYGDAFHRETDGSFSVRAGDTGDHAALLDALSREPGGIPGYAAHLTSFGASSRSAATATQVERGVLAVFVLVRAYMDRRDAGGLRLVFAHPLDERGCAVPAFAAVDGFARSLRRENPRFSVTSLAVDGDHWSAVAAELACDSVSAVRRERGHRRVRGYELPRHPCRGPRPK